MTHNEALEIIRQVGKAAQNSGPNIAIPLSVLPCSLGRAKYAFFVRLEQIIDDGSMTQAEGDTLKIWYSFLSRFINDDDAHRLADIHKKMVGKTATQEEIQTYMSFSRRALSTDLAYEINSYINELYGQRDNQDVLL